MIKLFFDFLFCLLTLIFLFPAFILISFLVFINDFRNPFYITNRVGKNFKIFKMIKFRSMIVDAEKTKVFSTKADDERITFSGKILRKFKLDEVPQLINILRFEMSFVGPRPNVEYEVNQYNNFEKNLLRVRPGITDLASIIFSDEAEILKNSRDPNRDYSLLIRPWKSALGNIYIQNQNLFLDLKIIFYTILNFLNRKLVLKKISQFVLDKTGDKKLSEICLREKDLVNYIHDK